MLSAKLDKISSRCRNCFIERRNSSWGSCRSHANASEGRRQLSTPGTGITKTASSAVDIFGAASTEYTLVGDGDGDGDGDGWLSSWTARRGSLSGKAHALASVQAAAMTSDLADITAALRGGASGG